MARVSWTEELQAEGFETASAAVREEVSFALDQLKQARVEALVDPDDLLATRIATWAGLQLTRATPLPTGSSRTP